MHEAFGESFDIRPGYLNTASIGVPTVTTGERMAQAIEDWRAGAAAPAEFDDDMDVARAAWARIVGVPAENVAIGAAVSQLVGLVAASIPDGTRVVAVRGEFTSVTFPIAAQAHRGVVVAEVDAGELVDAATNADLVAVSVVQSADGAIVDLAALRATGVPVLLDVTQAAGWLPLDLGWAHYVVGASYKWLMAPRGAAWLAVQPDRLAGITPHTANWFAADDRWQSIYGLPLRLATTARRLDVSPVWFAHRGAATALPWVASLDIAAVREHCVTLADTTLTDLGLAPRGSAIIALDLTAEQAARLADAGVAASTRAGRTRLSFHLYNTMTDVESVVRAVR